MVRHVCQVSGDTGSGWGCTPASSMHMRACPLRKVQPTPPHPPRINFLSQSNMNVLDVNVMANINNLWSVSGEPV